MNRFDEPDVQAIIDVLTQDLDFCERVLALHKVGADPDKRAARLAELAVFHPNPRVRANALTHLDSNHPERQALIEMAAREDPHPGVRAEAIGHLWVFHHQDQTPIAEIARTDPDDWPREAAVRSLCDMKLLAKIARSDPNRQTRAYAREQLSRLAHGFCEQGIRRAARRALWHARLAMLPEILMAAGALAIELCLTTGLIAWSLLTLWNAIEPPGAPRQLLIAIPAGITATLFTLLFRFTKIPASPGQLIGNSLRSTGALLVVVVSLYTAFAWLEPDYNPPHYRSFIQTATTADLCAPITPAVPASTLADDNDLAARLDAKQREQQAERDRLQMNR